MTEVEPQETTPGGRRGVRALAGVLLVESAIMVALTVFLIWEVFSAPKLSLGSSLGLVVLAAIGAVFLAALFVGVLRHRTRVRGGIVAWQVVQAAASVVVIQGDFLPSLGWVLALLSLAALILVNTKSVVEVLRRR